MNAAVEMCVHQVAADIRRRVAEEPFDDPSVDERSLARADWFDTLPSDYGCQA